jgi:hypothetical protein
MSISSLANAAIGRRTDFAPLDIVPQGLAEIAMAAATLPMPPTATRGREPAPAPPGANADAVNTALNVLFDYVPTEILTVYVAVLAAIQQPTAMESSGNVTHGAWIPFWCFLVATPVVVWLVYAAKVKAAEKPLPVSLKEWPAWEMTAATLAYCAWAFALPKTPFAEFDWYSSALAGIAVLIASTILGLLAPFFQNPIKP